MSDAPSQPQPAYGPKANPGGGPGLSLDWFNTPTVRPRKPDFAAMEHGFTLKEADWGLYGVAPDVWPYLNDTPRGAHPSDEKGLAAPYTIFDKDEVWAENAADLYEIAIRERWAPATDLPWNSLEPMSDVAEASLAQVLTSLGEQQYNALQVMSGWFQEISYGFHEIKLYLSTQVYDQARHVDVARKRAIAGGAALGVESPGFLNRTVWAAFRFTEFIVYVNILRTSFQLAMTEHFAAESRTQLDRQMFARIGGDLRRHLAYGVEHLKFYLQTDPDRRGYLRAWLARGEAMLSADLLRDTPTREALILLLGDTIAEGKQGLRALRQAQLDRYLHSLEEATVPGHGPHVGEALREVLEKP